MNTDNNDDPYGMKDWTIPQLLERICGHKPDSAIHQHAKIELKNRELLEQHEFNEKILARQHGLNLEIAKIQNKNARKNAYITAVSGFLGVIVGAMLAIFAPILATSLTRIPESSPKQILLPTTSSLPQGLPEKNPQEGHQDPSGDQNEKAKDDSFKPPVVSEKR